MSTSRRIQLGILVTVFVVMTLSALGVRQLVRAELVGQVDDQLESAAETMERIGIPEAAVQLAVTLEDQPDRESAVLVFGSDGGLIASVGSGSGAGDPLPDVDSVGIDGLRARAGETFGISAVDDSVDYRVVAAEMGDSVLVFATPLEEVRQTVGRVSVILLGASVLSLVLIGLATTVVIRRAISPIDDMIDTAAAIGGGDLSHRIDTSSHDREVLRLSGALNDMLHQLEDAFAEKDASEHQLRRFVADASHELRTPLASIRGYSELYLTGAATDDDSVERAMTRIQSEAVRTGRLVEDLLLLARLDQGRELDRAEVDLTSVVADAVADAEAVEPDRSISLALPDRAVTVVGDDARLRQVMANLLANTRDHAPGSPVEVSLTTDGHDAVIAVRDHGPGLDREQSAHVFERFWRADEVRNRQSGGSGLGLAILASIVEAHGGSIGVDAEPGAGATFTVRLPRDPVPREL